jgi:hypothetical protein
MPRVIVTTDPSQLPRDAAVLLDEQVQTLHLSTGHAAAQLVERIAWAISDAEAAERVRSTRSTQRARASERGSRRPRRAVQAVSQA